MATSFEGDNGVVGIVNDHAAARAELKFALGVVLAVDPRSRRKGSAPHADPRFVGRMSARGLGIVDPTHALTSPEPNEKTLHRMGAPTEFPWDLRAID
jgi:hypothetical protein